MTSSPGEATMSEARDVSSPAGAAPPAAPPAPPPAAAPARAPAPAAAPAAKDEETGLSRRLFLWSLPVGWIAFAAATASGLIATARSLFPNVLFEPPQSFKAGF